MYADDNGDEGNIDDNQLYSSWRKYILPQNTIIPCEFILSGFLRPFFVREDIEAASVNLVLQAAEYVFKMSFVTIACRVETL